jgi:hypothetical protein
MAMVVMAVYVFVVKVAVFEIGLLNQTGLQQQGNDAVNGRLGDLLAFPFQAQIQLVHIKVIMFGEDLFNDDFPFRCVPKSFVSNKVSKDLDFVLHCLFSDHAFSRSSFQ